jgi:L-threonylcarbamoyladenylate synthase
MIELQIDPTQPQPELISRAAAVIRTGGVVAFPTDTLYGLAVDPFDAAAVRRLFGVKGRDMTQAIPLIAADRGQVEQSLGALTPAAARLADIFWPGPLTLLVARSPHLVDEVVAGTGRVGVRVPAHVVARLLCQAVGRPLTATSANVSGRPATNTADGIDSTVRARIDLLLDAGATPGGSPSTIVDVTGTKVRLVRAGAISWERIEAHLAG